MSLKTQVGNCHPDLSPGAKVHVSIIICTRNRAASLGATLAAIDQVRIPNGWNAELIVVDNGSTDSTESVVRSAQLKNFKIQYRHESRRGHNNALNTGLAAAQGEALLFTDDDVAPAQDWLQKIASPILECECEGVTGKTQLADDLLRPWMKEEHKRALSVGAFPSGQVKELNGANMGLHRSVFQRIQGFDPELGPGASGFGGETLLAWQMCEAGLRLKSVHEALVTHHPLASRLLRSNLLQDARKRGASTAYLMHHWQHGGLKQPLTRLYYLSAKLLLRRLFQPPPRLNEEGCPTWEMSYVADIAMRRQFIKERRRPRNYERHGLQKREPQSANLVAS